MTTLNQFLERLRRDLADTDPANAQWSDHDLGRHLQHALTDCSHAIPLELSTTLQTLAACGHGRHIVACLAHARSQFESREPSPAEGCWRKIILEKNYFHESLVAMTNILSRRLIGMEMPPSLG